MKCPCFDFQWLFSPLQQLDFGSDIWKQHFNSQMRTKRDYGCRKCVHLCVCRLLICTTKCYYVWYFSCLKAKWLLKYNCIAYLWSRTKFRMVFKNQWVVPCVKFHFKFGENFVRKKISVHPFRQPHPQHSSWPNNRRWVENNNGIYFEGEHNSIKSHYKCWSIES